jgi:hypothetical protein
MEQQRLQSVEWNQAAWWESRSDFRLLKTEVNHEVIEICIVTNYIVRMQ